MKRVFEIIVCLFFCFYCKVTFAQEGNVVDVALSDSLEFALSNGEYEKAYSYVLELDREDSLSVSTLYDCAYCLLEMEKYQDCIDFCNKWGVEFSSVLGECYYYLSDYEQAVEYLTEYKKEIDEAGEKLSLYYNNMYSTSLYNTYKYKEADKVFEIFFQDILTEEGLNIDNIYLSKNKEQLAFKLYTYAYNSFFMGDEEKGMMLLELSSKCGCEYAVKDYQHLKNCGTVLMDLDLTDKIKHEFRSYIKKYDYKYKKSADMYSVNVSTEFWKQLLQEDEAYNELLSELDKKKKNKMLQKALTEIKSGKDDVIMYLKRCLPYKVGETEKGLMKKLTGDKNLINELRIYSADEPNAFATPYGQIYLTSSLVLKYNFNEHLLIGVCAHELTHFLCKHSLLNIWKQYEKERKNEIIGGVAAGLYAATMTATALYGAYNGVKYDKSYYDNIVLTSTNLFDAIESEAFYFKFKYSRSQEIQSDIMAYRFCEAIGVGGYAYIMALQLLGENDLYMKSEITDEHPTLAFRIALLKYIYQLDNSEIKLPKYSLCR